MAQRSRSTVTAAARRLRSAREAAEYADVSTRTLARWAATGIITAYRAGPKLVRYDMDELDAVIRPIPAAPAQSA